MTAHVITKATLAPAARNIGALLAETAAADGGHRLLWTLFPTDGDARKPRDFLYRRIDDRSYLVVSPTAPIDGHGLWQLGPKPYQPHPIKGERYTFILRANPALAIRQGQRASVRVDAVMHAKRAARAAGQAWGREQEEAAALDWLFKRENAIGVRFDKAVCLVHDYTQVHVPRKNDKTIAFSTVDYEGGFTVDDAEKLTHALLSGIGKARAFGCGLMLIRRA